MDYETVIVPVVTFVLFPHAVVVVVAPVAYDHLMKH